MPLRLSPWLSCAHHDCRRARRDVMACTTWCAGMSRSRFECFRLRAQGKKMTGKSTLFTGKINYVVMILNGLECPVRALRCFVRSFSFSAAVVPSRKSVLIMKWNCQALNTEPILDFFYITWICRTWSPGFRWRGDWGAIIIFDRSSRQHSLENTDFQLLICGHMLNHHSENQFETLKP